VLSKMLTWPALFAVLSGFPEHHNPHRLPRCLSRPHLASHWEERTSLLEIDIVLQILLDVRVVNDWDRLSVSDS
jgi:hypothetical protein